jgi:hypothetical protein
MQVARRFRGFLTVGLFLLTIVSTAQAKYSGGTGEPNDPYQIATAADLIALGETPAHYDKHFVMAADIDLDPNLPGRKVFDKAVIAPDTDPTPNDYGYNAYDGRAFTGVFDGAGHVISHLTVIGQDYLGLFGQLSGQARNLGVVGVKVSGSGSEIGGMAGEVLWGDAGLFDCYVSGTVSGADAVGGLVGYSYGTSTRCYSNCAVSGLQYVGGLVGVSEEEWSGLAQCHSAGTVRGTEYVGGLVGLYQGFRAVVQCFSGGRVEGDRSVGGLIGKANCGPVRESYSLASVSGRKEVGGLIGTIQMDEGSWGDLSRCYSAGAVTGESNVGGLVGICSECRRPRGGGDVDPVTGSFWDIHTCGQSTSAGGTGKTTAEMQMAKTFLEAGWDFVGETANGSEDIWKMAEGLSYPRLAWEKYSGGTGEPNDPYQIATAADLIALGETPEDYDKHFILTADIDLDPNLPGRKVFDKALIAPAGTSNFTGVFDGKGHKISRLSIEGDSYHLGLFGGLGSGGKICSLGMEATDVNGTGKSVGGLVGWNYEGSITNCYSTGMVSGTLEVGGLVGENFGYGSVTQCYSTAAVTGEGNVGGLVGMNWALVTQCYSAGTVTGTGGVGGLVGVNWALVTQCYSSAPVIGGNRVGGLVGSNDGVLTQCYSTGAVSATGPVGGLVGLSAGDVIACFWDTQTSGQATSAGGTGKSTAEMQMAKTFLEAGWDLVGETANGSEDIWKMAEGLSYPRLAWEKYSGGTGEPNDPYQIATAADLIALGETPADYGKHFILTADIDLDPNLPGRKVFDGAVIAPDGSLDQWGYFQGAAFTGVFDGNGHAISHLTITGDDCLGLFGYLGGAAEVKNLGLVDVNIIGSGDHIGALVGYNDGEVTQCDSAGAVTGGGSVGGLVGENGDVGTITMSYSTATVIGQWVSGSVTQCYSTGAVRGGSCLGGLVGENNKAVTHCYSTGVVSGADRVGGLVGDNGGATVTDCHSTSTVRGNENVGGLVGYNGGLVTQCHSTGVVSSTGTGEYPCSSAGGLVGFNGAGTVTDCYSAGAVSGDQCIGGLVGWSAGQGAVKRCYSTSTVCGRDYVGGLVGSNSSDTGWYGAGPDVSGCYSRGKVSGISFVGGLVGSNTGLVGDGESGTVDRSFWDTQTSGQTKSAGGTGLTTTEMQTANTFLDAGWDFVGETANGTDDIWWIDEGKDYPRLWWEGDGTSP